MISVIINGVRYVPDKTQTMPDNGKEYGKYTVGELVRRQRENLGMTRREVAESMGVSEARVGQIESDYTPDPRMSSLRRIHEVLDVPLDQLIYAKEVKK